MEMVEFASRFWFAYLVGLLVAIGISASSMVLSIAIGTIGAQARGSRYRAVRALVAAYVAVFRAVPPLLTLYFVYFGVPTWAAQADIPVVSQFFEPLNNRILSAVLAFALTSGAFSTEIIRSGIKSVSDDQIEAARSIGMSPALIFRRIIAPQAFRTAFPPLGSEYIYVLKGTSLASVIGVVELLRTAQLAAGATFQTVTAYSMAGAYYLVFVIALQITIGKLEVRLPGPRLSSAIRDGHLPGTRF